MVFVSVVELKEGSERRRNNLKRRNGIEKLFVFFNRSRSGGTHTLRLFNNVFFAGASPFIRMRPTAVFIFNSSFIESFFAFSYGSMNGLFFLLISIAIFVLAFLPRTIKSSAANCWLLYNVWNNDNFRNFFFFKQVNTNFALAAIFQNHHRKNNVIANDKCVIAKSVCGDFNDFNIFHSFCISWYGCRLPAEKQLYFWRDALTFFRPSMY